MKVTIDMDMTPEEARKLMGLPDIEPLQTAMMEKIQEQMEEYFNDIADPEAMFNKFMPLGINAMEQYKNFYSHIANSAYATAKKDAE
jgi:uncharacterized membrane-anchored protein YhcB (DUF1043 family)